MDKFVFKWADHFNVFRSIIGRIAVLVVNVFFDRDASAKRLLRHHDGSSNIAVQVGPRMLRLSDVYIPSPGRVETASIAVVVDAGIVAMAVRPPASGFSVYRDRFAASARAERGGFLYLGVGHAMRASFALSVASLGGVLQHALGAPSILSHLQPIEVEK